MIKNHFKQIFLYLYILYIFDKLLMFEWLIFLSRFLYCLIIDQNFIQGRTEKYEILKNDRGSWGHGRGWVRHSFVSYYIPFSFYEPVSWCICREFILTECQQSDCYSMGTRTFLKVIIAFHRITQDMGCEFLAGGL